MKATVALKTVIVNILLRHYTSIETFWQKKRFPVATGNLSEGMTGD